LSGPEILEVITFFTARQRELEKVCIVLAGFYTEKWLVNAEKIMKGLAYLKYFLHLLHSFPVFMVKAEISWLFAFK
jgi:hypothetical protein